MNGRAGVDVKSALPGALSHADKLGVSCSGAEPSRQHIAKGSALEGNHKLPGEGLWAGNTNVGA